MRHSILIAFGSLALATGCATGERLANSQPTVTAACSDRLSDGAARAVSFTVQMPDNQGRIVPTTVFAPSEPGTYPLIAFSHGAFATPGRYIAMLEPLAGAGFIIIAPMHIDSEEFPRAKGDPDTPPRALTWTTRNEDFALALNPPAVMTAALGEKGLSIDPERLIALGHSYGALIAQLSGGAIAFEPDGSQVDRTNADVDVVIGWSPPGAMAGFMAEEGWSSLTAPSLTLTGTTDIMPPFVEDWRAHKASHDNAPVGQRALWVGEGIDHYFGGVFGREKPVSEQERALFDRALATTLHFIETHNAVPQPCRLGSAISGETFEKD